MRFSVLLLVVVGSGCQPDASGDLTLTGGPSSSPSQTATGSIANTTTPDPTDSRVLASGPITCADPSARDGQPMTLSIVGADWPVPEDFDTTYRDLRIGSRGLVLGDFDSDGVDDLFVPRDDFQSVYLRGNGDGTFEDRSVEAFGTQEIMAINGGTSVDFDGDGDLDIIVFRLMRDSSFLVNDGTGVFTEELFPPEWFGDNGFACGGTASFADYNRDGVLDFFYGRLGLNDRITYEFTSCPSFLLKGLGGGTFADESIQLNPTTQDNRMMASGWYDLNADGWLDLYTASDCAPAPQPNQVLFNDEGTLFWQGGSGLEVRLASMGLGAGDLNWDGLPDLVVPGINEYALLLSDASLGIWVDSADAWNLTTDRDRSQEIGWGGEMVDLNNDGLLDMPFTFGMDAGAQDGGWSQPDEIYLNTGNESMEAVGIEWGFDQDIVGRGVITVDLNDDGWLDIVKRELGGAIYVHLATCGEEAWMEVGLVDPVHPNRDAIGATITLVAGDKRYIRYITAGSTSYTSDGPPEAHFGLGDLDFVDSIEVQWPTGELTVHPGQQTRQKLQISRL